MDMRVAISKNENDSVELYFVGIEHWDDFDLILGLLQQENNCTILSNQEIIYMRKAELELNKVTFELRHDDMLGNFLYTKDNRHIPLLEQLANQVIESVKQKLRAKGITV
ncbi:MAG: hypothetical protein GX567_19450 [Clostridia bacterium]|nr:hypothetical protein [Clostridia bacterium]